MLDVGYPEAEVEMVEDVTGRWCEVEEAGQQWKATLTWSDLSQQERIRAVRIGSIAEHGYPSSIIKRF